MTSRWDRLMEQKPRPIVEHLLDEAAKLMAQELAKWPPEVAELEASGAKFGPLLAPGYPRPGRAVYQEAFRIARWELEREIEAVDDYMRNQRFLENGLSSQDRLALLFLSRWLEEQLLGLSEATEGRINRPKLVDCLERIRRRFDQTLLA